MPYNKHNFKEGDVLTAQALNEMEDGIKAVEGEIPAPYDDGDIKSAISKLEQDAGETKSDIGELKDDIAHLNTLTVEKPLGDSKNFFDEVWTQGTITSDGTLTTSTTSPNMRSNHVAVDGGKTIVLSWANVENVRYVYYAQFDANKAIVKKSTAIGRNTPVTLEQNTAYIAVKFEFTAVDYVTSPEWFQAEYGTQSTPYMPKGSATETLINYDKVDGLPQKINDLEGKTVDTDVYAALVVDENDKAESITWQRGYRIMRYNRLITSTSSYSVADIAVHKGDIITIDFTEAIPDTVAIICRKHVVGTNAYYEPLTMPLSAAHYEYTAPQDMTLTLSIKHTVMTAVHWYGVPAYSHDIDTKDSFVRFPRDEIVPKLVAMSANPMDRGAVKQKPLTLLHYSDVHGHTPNVVNIKEFMDKYGQFVNDAIITGDMVGSKYPDYIPVYREPGFNKIMLCIGNHDVYDHNGNAVAQGASSYSDEAWWATPAEKYAQYIAPTVANWGVTQPSGAAANGLCYYYKDYSLTASADSSTVTTLRLIVLDGMAYNAAQHTWLETTLASAKAAHMAVVIADHFVPTETDNGDYNLFDTSFASIYNNNEMWYGLSNLGYRDAQTELHKAADLVDSFIDGGGEFVCWLAGHLHYCKVGTLASHPNQIVIAVESAACDDKMAFADVPRKDGDKSEDLFNIIAVDTFNKVLKVMRVGAEWDVHMRHRGAMSIDYAHRKLLSSY